MKCSKCQYYSYGVKRCLLGKVNPPSLKGGAEAMETFEFSYVCSVDKENRDRAKKMRAIVIKKMMARGLKDYNPAENDQPHSDQDNGGIRMAFEEGI